MVLEIFGVHVVALLLFVNCVVEVLVIVELQFIRVPCGSTPQVIWCQLVLSGFEGRVGQLSV